MNLREYQARAFTYSAINWDDPNARHIAPLGLLGELGSLAGESKKIIRDGAAYTDGQANLKVEYGDLLWYLAALATKAGISLEEMAAGSPTAQRRDGASHVYRLGVSVGAVVKQVEAVLSSPTPDWLQLAEALRPCIRDLLTAIQTDGIALDAVLEHNIAKSESYFGPADERPAPCYDASFAAHERLPRTLNIQVLELTRGKDRREVILRANGLNIGDRLTDNAVTDDGYRFHDAFHFAYVAVLGWSPVTRALLKCKRKSDSVCDEVQDGARAAIMEEAITHAMWNYARGNSLLENVTRIDHNILTLIQRMVRGLEVQDSALHEWQKAFFVGFEAFRKLQTNHGGWLKLDAENRSLTYSATEPT